MDANCAAERPAADESVKSEQGEYLVISLAIPDHGDFLLTLVLSVVISIVFQQ